MKFFFHQSYKGFFLLLFLLSIFSCTKQTEPDRNPIILTEYPNLANEIIGRDFDGLWDFTEYQNEYVRALAWNAISKSESDNLQSFVDFAFQEDDSLVWHTLSSHLLSVEQVDSIGQQFAAGQIQSESVNRYATYFLSTETAILWMFYLIRRVCSYKVKYVPKQWVVL
ncbi:MAG: hypothetical protein GVY07_07935 [Bacteroidetes bacterium]|jgi:hypothetical protein|nr:hypothetical protein [Bacteroidota bacterium]